MTQEKAEDRRVEEEKWKDLEIDIAFLACMPKLDRSQYFASDVKAAKCTTTSQPFWYLTVNE